MWHLCEMMYLYKEMCFSNSRGISSNSFKHDSYICWEYGHCILIIEDSFIVSFYVAI